ncbi:type III secretion system inner membrane ring lipoprotein SctJ [Cognatiyoonia sp. IB215182]|uniref:type III secretion system inner membrane ring lipoprotein SctJ n=1 Tax=Cognatiyoonia sp. IB215182 TaxID=3097353 RepID=UPI002A0FB193|nr:type III secretion inner membrane ring lipoprotein SctJ [Cognatiyoonia sp. IB215182]MDX8355132.1 type III secretion inner membrane ring lipoprotein SctJ [Cognatiyoonia sp. IB215182]
MWRIFLILCFCLLSACKTDLYRNLSEREANEMLAVLMSNNIEATKEYLGDAGVTLQVEEADLPRAIDILKQNGFPRESRESMGTVFERNGIMSSPFEERVRFVYALGEEVSRTLSEIDGVLTARVHIVLPDEPDFGEQLTPSSAAVFIKHRVGVDLDFATPQIRRLVSSSIEGVTYDDVTVLLVEAERPTVTARPEAAPPVVEIVPGLGIRAADAQMFRWGVGGAAALLVLLALTNIFTLFGFAKARKASKEAELALQDQSAVAE